MVFGPLVVPDLPPIHQPTITCFDDLSSVFHVVIIQCLYSLVGSPDWCGMEECNRISPFRKLHTKLWGYILMISELHNCLTMLCIDTGILYIDTGIIIVYIHKHNEYLESFLAYSPWQTVGCVVRTH